MGNRSEQDMEAIQGSIDAEAPEGDESATRGDFKSKFVYEAVGVPKDPAVLAAVDKWANVWGEEIYPLMKDEGLADESNPEHVEALSKLNEAGDELKELVPSAKFNVGSVVFEGGHVQLSA